MAAWHGGRAMADQAEQRARKHCTHWIGGKPWTGAEPAHRGEIYNPATGQVTGTVDFATAAEVDAAATSAAAAFPHWRDTSLVKRASVMFAFRELIRQHAPELARLISSEHGKVASDALGEVAGITPFNFPAMVPMWMFPIAIAAGNTFVLKPSEKDPSASIRIAELLAEAGLPDGVF